MGDRFYKLVRAVGTPAFWVSSRPVVRGRESVPRSGACIIAATHQSPYDVPLLIRHTPRMLDFVSIVEVFRNPLVAWFYGSLNAFPLDRTRPDAKTVRTILDRLRRGRAVVMFPEGGFRRGAASVVHSRRIRPGIGRLAAMSGTAIVPCVVFNSLAYSRVTSWFPLGRTRYGVAYGAPLRAEDSDADGAALEARLVGAMVELHRRLSHDIGVADLNAPDAGGS